MTSTTFDPSHSAASYDTVDLRIHEHTVTVPISWRNPERGSLSLFIREVVAHDVEAETLPALIFLQGGPGGESPRPPATAWVKWAAQHFRVFLLDQRGTGRSTPVTAHSMTRFIDAHGGGIQGSKAAADWLSHYRADDIADDVAYLKDVLNDGTPWITLGQSFGGFITVSLLSHFPEAVRAAVTTGGIPAIDRSADTLYEDLIPLQIARNESFRAQFPSDQALLDDLAARADAGELVTLSGEPISARRLQMLGWSFGMSTGIENLHWLLDTALESDGAVSQRFIETVAHQTAYVDNPLYLVLQESCYHQGHRDGGWGAWTTLQRHPEFSATAQPLLTFAEYAQPWMFTEITSLRPFAGVVEELQGERDWSQLWDVATLQQNTVPLASIQYTDDPYVGLAGAKRTLDNISNSRLWEDPVHLHDALRVAGPTILPKLFAMVGVFNSDND